jgi:D-alanyl-D-alanine carboxypeptidase
MVLLAHAAFSLPEVLRFAKEPNYLIHALNSSRTYKVRTTNRLLDSPKPYQIVAAKTGHLDAKSYHLVIQAEQDGHSVLLVLLGEPSDAVRFSDADTILRWAYSAHQWQRQVE